MGHPFVKGVRYMPSRYQRFKQYYLQLQPYLKMIFDELANNSFNLPKNQAYQKLSDSEKITLLNALTEYVTFLTIKFKKIISIFNSNMTY